MKRFVILAILFLSALAAPSQAQEAFTTIKITYKAHQRGFGSTGELFFEKVGTQTKWIDVPNNKRRVESRFEFLGSAAPSQEHQLEILDGQKIYTVDLLKKTGVITDLVLNPVWMDFQGQKTSSLGEETILERSCAIHALEGTQLWVWGHLVLKQHIKTDLLDFTLEATSIEENLAIDPKLFVPPDDVTLESFEESMARVEEGIEFVKDSGDYFDQLMVWSTALQEELGIPGIAASDYFVALLNPNEAERVAELIGEAPLPEEQKQAKLKRFKDLLFEKSSQLDAEMPREMRAGLMEMKIPSWLKTSDEEMAQAIFQGAWVNAQMAFLACERYRDRHGYYPEALSQLVEDLPESIVAKMDTEAGLQSYRYTYVRTDPDHFELFARPTKYNGQTLYVDQTGVFRLGGKEGPAYVPEEG